LIKVSIPKKADITQEEIIERLSTNKHYIQVALDKEKVQGLIVSYEVCGDLYLWLGAMKKPGNGMGSKMFNLLEEQTNYDRWFVKTGEKNNHALYLLNKYGFKEYYKGEDVVYLERRL